MFNFSSLEIILLGFSLSFLVAVLAIPLLKSSAIRFGLVDQPGGRKIHTSPTPLIGGSAIILASVFAFLTIGIPEGYQGFIIAGSGLFLVGLIDDKTDLNAKLRLFLQAGLITFALYWDAVWLTDIKFTDNIIWELGTFRYLLSVLVILALINAINMLDGIDGLSSGITLIILTFLIGFSVISNQYEIAGISACLAGGVLGFWLYNYRFPHRQKAFTFMGDSGTLLLGFAIPYLAIKLSSIEHSSIAAPTLLWLFAVPIWDIFAVMFKRIKYGISPFKAGRDHIHHELMNNGLSQQNTLHFIYLLSLCAATTGVTLQFFNLVPATSFVAFVVVMGIYLNRFCSASTKQNANIYEMNMVSDSASSNKEIKQA